MKSLFSVLACIALLSTAPAQAGAEAGSPIPHTLVSTDQSGAARTFENLRGEKGAVLVFVRSAKWCPHCQKQLIELKDIQAEIEAQGFALISISYDPVETLALFTTKRKIGYTMLSDKGSEIIKAFGILNENVDPDSDKYGIPNPAIYVVDAAGTIRAVLAEENYKKRPSHAAILEALKSQ